MKVTRAQIRESLGALAGSGEAVSGAALRRELASRYGARGGVRRVYRELRSWQLEGRRTPRAPEGAPGAEGLRLGGRAAVESGSAGDGQGGAAVARLEEELGALRTRAERAEYRERAHQDRWASEVHALRQRVTELEGQLSQLPALRAALERTALALRAAESRLAEVDRR